MEVFMLEAIDINFDFTTDTPHLILILQLILPIIGKISNLAKVVKTLIFGVQK